MTSVILGLDPARRTGWSVWEVAEDGLATCRDSGDIPGGSRDIEDHLARIVPPDIDFLGIELGYVADGGIQQALKHHIRIGYMMGWIHRHVGTQSLPIYSPQPDQWRKVLRRRDIQFPQGPRKLCKARAVELARELGRECRGPRGGDRQDEADAVCIGLATAYHYLSRTRLES